MAHVTVPAFVGPLRLNRSMIHWTFLVQSLPILLERCRCACPSWCNTIALCLLANGGPLRVLTCDTFKHTSGHNEATQHLEGTIIARHVVMHWSRPMRSPLVQVGMTSHWP
jgi:hypothetical protein